MALEIGDSVRVVTPVIEGKVTGAAVQGTALMLLVEYLDENGNSASRYFKAEQLEALPVVE